MTERCPGLTHLLAVLVGAAPGPEEVGADADGSTLVGFLQQLGGSQCTLGPQRLVVLLAEAAHPLKGPDDQRDGGQLGFGVADLVLVQGEGLQGATAVSGDRDTEMRPKLDVIFTVVGFIF